MGKQGCNAESVGAGCRTMEGTFNYPDTVLMNKSNRRELRNSADRCLADQLMSFVDPQRICSNDADLEIGECPALWKVEVVSEGFMHCVDQIFEREVSIISNDSSVAANKAPRLSSAEKVIKTGKCFHCSPVRFAGYRKENANDMSTPQRGFSRGVETELIQHHPGISQPDMKTRH